MEGNIQSSPYANVWKQDLPSSRTLMSSGGGTEVGTVSGAREQKRLAYEKQELDDAARRYSQDNMVSFEKARSLMEKKLRNMRLQSEYKIDQESRDIDAENKYIEAQSELSNISFTDKDALNKLSKARAKWTSGLAGTKHEEEWAKSISSIQTGIGNYQTGEHYRNLDDPEKQVLLTKSKEIASAQAKAPYEAEAEKARREGSIQRAILQYAVNQNMSVSEATEALYPSEQKPMPQQGKPSAASPAMPQNVVTKIPQGSDLQISGGLGTPVFGASQPSVPNQESNKIIAPIEDSEAPQASNAVSAKPLTKEVIHSLADELGADASKESLMDLAKKRGYTF